MNYNVTAKDVSGIPKLILTSTDFTDQQCYDAFVAEMNKKAEELGMENTTFVNPHGIVSQGTGNTSCARDFARLAVEATSYHQLNRVWNKHTHTISLGGGRTAVASGVTEARTEFETYHHLLGYKTGSSGGHRTLTVVSEHDGSIYAGTIMEAISGATDTESEANRWRAMKQLFDIVFDVEDAPESVTYASYACCFKVPQCADMHEYSYLTPVYSQSDTTVNFIASMTKIMTMIVAIDWLEGRYHDKIVFKQSDIISGSGQLFTAGDVVSVEDVMYAVMLPSSNQAAHALARYVGEIILRRNNYW